MENQIQTVKIEIDHHPLTEIETETEIEMFPLLLRTKGDHHIGNRRLVKVDHTMDHTLVLQQGVYYQEIREGAILVLDLVQERCILKEILSKNPKPLLEIIAKVVYK